MPATKTSPIRLVDFRDGSALDADARLFRQALRRAPTAYNTAGIPWICDQDEDGRFLQTVITIPSLEPNWKAGGVDQHVDRTVRLTITEILPFLGEGTTEWSLECGQYHLGSWDTAREAALFVAKHAPTGMLASDIKRAIRDEHY